jgi:hypothetical protein
MAERLMPIQSVWCWLFKGTQSGSTPSGNSDCLRRV